MTIRTRLFLAYALFLCLPVIVAAGIFWAPLAMNIQEETQETLVQAAASSLGDLIETSTEASIGQTIGSVLEHNVAILSSLQRNTLSGALTTDEARWLASEILSSQKIGKHGYLFSYDSKRLIRTHPDKALLKTQIPETYLAQPTGGPPECGKAETAGHSSLFPTPYRLTFAPWGWTIAAALDPCERMQLAPLEAIKKDLARRADNRPFTPFLIDGSGLLWQPALSGMTNLNDHPTELAALFENLRTADDGLISLRLLVKKDQAPRDFLLAFHRLKAYNLTVGVFADTADPATFQRPRNAGILFPSLVVAALLLLLTAFGVSCFFSDRFRLFLSGLVTAAEQQSELHLGGTRIPEFLKLGNSFNRLLQEIREGRDEVLKEKLASKTNLNQLEREISNRKEAQQKLLTEIATRRSAENYLQLFKNIFDSAIEGIFITDQMARILTVNHSFTEITGYTEEETVGNNPRMLSSARQGDDSFQRMWQHLKTKGSWSGEIWFKFKDETVNPQWLSISEIRGENGETTHYFAFFHDISDLKKKEQQISFMAYRDRLTRLPNRAALEGRLAKAISRASRDRLTLAVFFIDLDNFKNINDSLGHDKGDLVLITVAERLTKIIRSEDTLSRLGGDEFILLSEDIENESAIFNLASRILDSFKKPIAIGPSTLYINASIGISIYPNDGQTPQVLIKNADMAMYKAKSEGKNRFVLFTQEMNEKLLTRIRIENAIRTGLKKKEFVVFYQPKIDLLTETTTSFEALIRWARHNTIVGPSEFVPIAEDSGLIDEMSLYVINEVCLFLRKVTEEGLPVFPVSVNMSPRTFNNLEIVEIVDGILESHRIDHRHIEFEITESTAMQDVQHTVATMRRFRQRGIHFSIDDFGTGYSSLSYLSEMPVSTLKIDKRFIAAGDANSRSIVSAIAAISKQMQLKVVAEGVETRDQMLWLRHLGCNEAQGYYYSKPKPESATIHDLRTGHEWKS